jgi:hypothetical protein
MVRGVADFSIRVVAYFSRFANLGKRTKNQTGPNGRFSEGNTKPTEIDLYFNYPTTADVF